MNTCKKCNQTFPNRTVVDMNIEPDHLALAEMAKKLAF
jgi:hypothetical protein